MNSEHKKILELLSKYLEKNPEQRFGQAIFNLGINQFSQNEDYQLRDIHGDSDSEIITRIEKQLFWFELQEKVQHGKEKINNGMTVNERLFVSGLMEIFEEMKSSNKEYAVYILKSLKVDEDSITKILN